MLIRIGFDIDLGLSGPTALVHLLQIHPDHDDAVVEQSELTLTPALPTEHYLDVYGNRCARTRVPAGIERVRLQFSAIVEDSGMPDPQAPSATQHAVEDLPLDTLMYLLPSRYCDVDSELMEFAWREFGHLTPGWARTQAICDHVFGSIRYDGFAASPRHTALDTHRLSAGVCRDFAHLAIALCRALNIPARYVSGYLGDIHVPPLPSPMDFHAWFEVYLDGRWWAFDARHNTPRIGRVALAKGRDAADVPITMVFGTNLIHRFDVVADEISPDGLVGDAVA